MCCSNPYTYPLDPINGSDLTGQCSLWNCIKKGLGYAGRAARVYALAPLTAGAAGWGAAHGGSCGWNGTRWTVVCSGMSGGYGPRAGITIGGTYLTGAKHPDAATLRHEAKHSNQWFAFGPVGFPVAYGLDEWLSGGGSHNNFEQQAGLHDSCYLPWRGC